MTNVSVQLKNCKCGSKQELIETCCGAWVRCPKMRWWNFWKHDETVQIAYFPCKHTFSGLGGTDDGKQDQGHLDLESDVVMLLKDTKDFQFHDFKNTKYSLPKMALIERLQAMILKAKEGGYDN